MTSPKASRFPSKADVDANFIKLMKTLLKSGIYHGIATHDEHMLSATRDFAKSEKIPNEAYEFQMLYGVRQAEQIKLARAGHRMRTYVPYGEYWYPYFMRRLAERPANVWFVLKNLIKGMIFRSSATTSAGFHSFPRKTLTTLPSGDTSEVLNE